MTLEKLGDTETRTVDVYIVPDSKHEIVKATKAYVRTVRIDVREYITLPDGSKYEFRWGDKTFFDEGAAKEVAKTRLREQIEFLTSENETDQRDIAYRANRIEELKGALAALNATEGGQA